MRIVAAGILVLTMATVALYLMFVGPRMRLQPKIPPNQARMPAWPPGIIAVSADSSAVPPAEAAEALKNPLPDTARTRRTGQVYYGYYCLFCHGRTGRGDGPVGNSYTPVPTDLTSPAVQELSDGALYRAMLTGVGHDPVLPQVVEPEARWYIVSHVRSLPIRNGTVREANDN